MNKYDQLLSLIAEEYGLERGDCESEESFKARIVYGAIARQSYASLWDRSDDDARSISIVHFKGRIDELARIYLELYSEAKQPSDLPIRIYNLYSRTGLICRRSRRMRASMFCAAELDGLWFVRGAPPSLKVRMSGAGFFLPSNEPPRGALIKSFDKLFGLSKKILPPIKFQTDGALVHAKIPYLLPTGEPLPTELYLLRLYGWQTRARHAFDAKIFFALKNFLERGGQKFVRE